MASKNEPETAGPSVGNVNGRTGTPISSIAKVSVGVVGGTVAAVTAGTLPGSGASLFSAGLSTIECPQSKPVVGGVGGVVQMPRSNSSSFPVKVTDSVGQRRGHSPVIVDLTRIDVELHSGPCQPVAVGVPETPVPTPPPPPGTSKHINSEPSASSSSSLSHNKQSRKSSAATAAAAAATATTTKKKLHVFGKRPKISAPEMAATKAAASGQGQSCRVLPGGVGGGGGGPPSATGTIGGTNDTGASVMSVRNSTSSTNGCNAQKKQYPIHQSHHPVERSKMPFSSLFRRIIPKSQSSYGGLRSKKLKPLIHPLDRSIVGIFTLTIFFTILAILTGAPTVLCLFILVPVGIFLDRLFLCQWSTPEVSATGNNPIGSGPAPGNPLSGDNVPAPMPLSPIDLYWLVQGAITHCVLYIDKGLSAEQLRDVVASRLLTRPELSRFRSKIVMRGLWNTPHWGVPESLDESLDYHIVERPSLPSKHALRVRIMSLMEQPLPIDKPLWQIEYAAAEYCPHVVLIVRVHQTLSQSGLVSILTHYLADSAPTGPPLNTPTRPRFGGTTLSINIFRAVIVGPLTFTLWIIWAFTRRRHNYLIPSRRVRSIHWCSFDLAKIIKIKQITRSTLNDVIFSMIAGSIRSCLAGRTPIDNPPDLTVSLPIDIRPATPLSASLSGVNYVLTTSPLPTNTEGAIPRLWEVRHLMEELKTSADTAVMFGAHYLFSILLPRPLYRYIINLVNRNSSLYLSNIQGPTPGSLSIGSHRLQRVHYFLSPPSYCAITYNVLTIDNRLCLAISTKSRLLPKARELTAHFQQQIELLSQLLARRRVPGESKRARQICARHPQGTGMVTIMHPNESQALTMHQYYDSGAYYPQLDSGTVHQHVHGQSSASSSVSGGSHHSLISSVLRPSHHHSTPASHIHLPEDSHHLIDQQHYDNANLSDKLHEIQDELNRLSQAYEMNEPGVVAHYELLKSQFTSLLHEMRRRKSIADYGQSILINIENEDDDDENDGELRPPPRRFSVVSIGRRGSIVPNIPGPSRVTPPILSRRARGSLSGATPSSASPEPPSSPDLFSKVETEC